MREASKEERNDSDENVGGAASGTAAADRRHGGARIVGGGSQPVEPIKRAGKAGGGRGTPDLEERAEIYHQVALMLNEDVPTIFWWANNLIWGMNANLEGVRPGPNQHIWWNIQEWSLAEA